MVKVEFRDWLWDKFEEWRKGTTKGPTAFARYLGIKEHQNVSAWLNGRYKPKSQEHISKLAEKFPDVYEALGVPPPRQVTIDQLPPELREDFEMAMSDLRTLFAERGVDPTSEEGIKSISEILSRYGFTITSKR